MVRNILAVVAGVITGSICIWLIETLNHILYPFPKGIKPNDIESFKSYVENLPFLGKFMVIIGYVVGAVVSGFVSTKIAKNGKLTSAAICGIIFMSFTIYNMTVLPTPVWFWVLGIVVWGLVFVGGKLALNKK
jgi:hypothetical protein